MNSTPPSLRLQLESPPGRIPRLELQKFHARDRDIAANLPEVDQLGGRDPVALRMAYYRALLI